MHLIAEKTTTNPILLSKGDLIEIAGNRARVADHPTVVNSVMHLSYELVGRPYLDGRKFQIELPAYISIRVFN